MCVLWTEIIKPGDTDEIDEYHKTFKLQMLAIFSPKKTNQTWLFKWWEMFGYVTANIKNRSMKCSVGDTITLADKSSIKNQLHGLSKMNPMVVIVGMYPVDSSRFYWIYAKFRKTELNECGF